MASSSETQTGEEDPLRESSNEEGPREQLYKVLVIGDFGVGKQLEH